MKIDKVSGGQIHHTSFDQAPKKSPENISTPRISESNMNTNTVALEKAQAQMASLPDIDMAKVEQVRNDLAQGKISLDTDALAKAVHEFYTGH